MSQERKTSTDELILDVLREVLARQEQQNRASPRPPDAALLPPPPAATTPVTFAGGTSVAPSRPRLDPETRLMQTDLEQC